VAGMIHRIHRRAMMLEVLEPVLFHPNAAQEQSQANAPQPDGVKDARVAEDQCEEQRRRPDEENVQRDDNVGREGSESGNDDAHCVQQKGPKDDPSLGPGINRRSSYDAFAVRRALTRVVGAAFAALARAIDRVLVAKQRSSARSTFSSMASDF